MLTFLHLGHMGGPQKIRGPHLETTDAGPQVESQKINDWVWERLSLTSPTHPYRPGDAVWVKEWIVQLLKLLW
jgi:hypothetical protein